MNDIGFARGLINRFLAALIILTLGGCSWFSWLPWVDEDTTEDTTKPAKLQPFNAEVNVSVQWKRQIGEGLAKNISG